MSNPFSNVEKVNAIIRVRRGPEIDRTDTIYETGELVYSTDTGRLYVGDSEDNGITGTYGGLLVGNKVWVTNNFEKLSGICQYDLVYRTDSAPDIGTGFYLLTGTDYIKPNNYILVGSFNNSNNTGTFNLPRATSTTLGGVIIKDGLIVDNGFLRVGVDDSTIKIDPATKKLYATNTSGNNNNPSVVTATESILGIVKVPTDSGITVSNGALALNVDSKTIKLSSNGKVYVDPTQLSIPVATTSTLGVVKAGTGLSITTDGELSVKTATLTQIGGVKVGDGLTIDSNGALTLGGSFGDILNNYVNGISAYITPNTTATWTCPIGVTKARVLVIGGAGAGGDGFAANCTLGSPGADGYGGSGGNGGDDNGGPNAGSGGGGGGGAGAAMAIINVIAGQSYSIKVGSNGVTNVSSGSPSMFNTTVSSTSSNQIYAGAGFNGTNASGGPGGAGGKGGICSWNGYTVLSSLSQPTIMSYISSGYGNAGVNGTNGTSYNAGAGGAGGAGGLNSTVLNYHATPKKMPDTIIRIDSLFSNRPNYSSYLSYTNPCVVICW